VPGGEERAPAERTTVGDSLRKESKGSRPSGGVPIPVFKEENGGEIYCELKLEKRKDGTPSANFLNPPLKSSQNRPTQKGNPYDSFLRKETKQLLIEKTGWLEEKKNPPMMFPWGKGETLRWGKEGPENRNSKGSVLEKKKTNCNAEGIASRNGLTQGKKISPGGGPPPREEPEIKEPPF